MRRNEKNKQPKRVARRWCISSQGFYCLSNNIKLTAVGKRRQCFMYVDNDLTRSCDKELQRDWGWLLLSIFVDCCKNLIRWFCLSTEKLYPKPYSILHRVLNWELQLADSLFLFHFILLYALSPWINVACSSCLVSHLDRLSRVEVVSIGLTIFCYLLFLPIG